MSICLNVEVHCLCILNLPANQKLDKMKAVLDNPNDKENEEKINKAFGANANRDKIKETVEKMRAKHMPIRTPDHTEFGANANAKVSFHDKQKTVGANKNIFKHAELGGQFYGLKPDDQAGSLIHEASHFLSYTGDHVQHGTNKIILSNEPRMTSDTAKGGCGLPCSFVGTS